MLNDLFRTYKKIIFFVLILLCGIIFWFFGCHRQNNNAVSTEKWEREALSESGGFGYRFQTEDLEGKVIFGTRGYLAKDKTMPVTVSMKCQEDSFTGVIKITLPGEEGGGVAYQSAISCDKGITRKVRMEIPHLGNVSFFSFQVLDQFGTARLSQMVYPIQEDENHYDETIYLGVLSDQYEKLKYLDGQELDLGDDTAFLKLICFTGQNFPVKKQGLQALSGILIDSFDTYDLSQTQLECLEQWLQEGGSLILGTGEDAQKVLSGIHKLLGVKAGAVEEIKFSFSDSLSSAGSLTMMHCNLKIKEEKLWASNNKSFPTGLYHRQYGKGNVSLMSFSLLDSVLNQWTGRDKVTKELFQDCLENNWNRTFSNETSLWYVKKALYAFMNEQMPNTFYYGVYFICYLLVLGVVAYYFLRRIKKREYIWWVVPMIALVFTIGVLIRSRGVGGDSGREFSAIRVYDPQVAKDDIYFLYQNNEGEGCSVDIVPEVKAVEPLDYSYRMDERDATSVKGINENFTINNTQKGFDIVFGETVPGASQVLKYSIDSTGVNQTDTCFYPTITGNYTSFQGDIINTSEYHFDKLVLVRGNQYKIIDDVSSGETVRVEEQEVKFWTGFDDENVVFGDGDETTAIGNLMEYLQQKYINGEGDLNTLLAIGITDENDFSLFADEHKLENQLTVFVNRFALNPVEDAECIVDMNHSCLDEESQEELLRYDILDKNETKVVYTFDSGKVVWGMFRNRDSFQGNIYAYNYETRENDLILNEENEYMNCESLEPYLSDMNRMIVTYCLSEDTDYGGAPVISVFIKDL